MKRDFFGTLTPVCGGRRWGVCRWSRWDDVYVVRFTSCEVRNYWQIALISMKRHWNIVLHSAVQYASVDRRRHLMWLACGRTCLSVAALGFWRVLTFSWRELSNCLCATLAEFSRTFWPHRAVVEASDDRRWQDVISVNPVCRRAGVFDAFAVAARWGIWRNCREFYVMRIDE